MYEPLTPFLSELQEKEYTKWTADNKNDSSQEQQIQFPYVVYGETVTGLEKAIYRLIDDHDEMELNHYGDILESANIEWGSESMKKADVSALDGKTVMALLVGAVRADHFSGGALLSFCEDGSVVRWLKRLKEIDESAN